MANELFPGYRDERQDSKYPFIDQANLTSLDGLVFPRSAISDACFYPPGSPGDLYLRSVDRSYNTITFVLADSQSSSRATGSFQVTDIPEELRFQDEYGRECGLMILTSNTTELLSWGEGEHQFRSTASALCPTAVMPIPSGGVEGFLLDDGTVVSGEVWFVGEDGVVLREIDENVIRMDVVGDPLFQRRMCDPDDLFETPRYIKSISGFKADEYGRLRVTSPQVSALRIYTDGGALILGIAGGTRRS